MSEPILWAQHAANLRRRPAKAWNPTTEQWEQVIDEETGLPLIEKVPQGAHVDDGNDRNPTIDQNVRRFIHYLRHDGHVVRAVINMAAADVEGADFVGKHVRGKARFLGWIPVGRCPIAMRLSGELQAAKIADVDLRTATSACERSGPARPCPHYFAEETARKQRNARVQGKRAAGMATESDKMIKAQKESTKEIVTGVAEVLAGALKALKEPDAPPPPPADPAPEQKGKR